MKHASSGVVYKNRERIVEPHDYGIRNGIATLLAYQVAGSSSHKLPNWRWMETELISGMQILNRTFPGGRPTPTGKHHKWDKLFIRVKPADKGRNSGAHSPYAHSPKAHS
jgi:hypothetical protein